MTKKFLASAVVLALSLCMASCKPQAAPASDPAGMPAPSAADLSGKTNTSTVHAEEGSMLDKLYQIKKDWTEEQVHALLGGSGKDGETSVFATEIYRISDTIQATIEYRKSGIHIRLDDSETGKYRYIELT